MSGACSATNSTTSQWSGGYQGEVKVTAGSAAIKSWTVTLTYGSTPSVQQSWNSTVTVSGNSLVARNVAYTGAVSAGRTASFGFIGSGTAATPTVCCTATT